MSRYEREKLALSSPRGKMYQAFQRSEKPVFWYLHFSKNWLLYACGCRSLRPAALLDEFHE